MIVFFEFVKLDVHPFSGDGYLLLSSFVQDSVIKALDAVLSVPSNPLVPALYWPIAEPLFEEQDALIAMVKRLHWKFIGILVDQHQEAEAIVKAFKDIAAKEDICVVATFHINTNKY